MKYIPWIIAAIAVVILFLNKDKIWGEGPKTDTVMVVTRIDTTRGNVTINNWQPKITVDMPKTDQPKVLDTLAVVREYLQTNHYDTAFKDTNIDARIGITISRNRIQSFALNYTSLARTREITLKEAPQIHISLGAFLGGRAAFDYGVAAIYQPKSKVSYMALFSLQDKALRVGAALPLK